MAMDYLPIQATAVPCERVFSSSAETDTKQRNRIHPDLMEVLQMQKFLLKKACLNVMDAWIMAEKEMLEDEPEHDLLSTLLEGNIQDKLDQVMKAIAYDNDNVDT
jgi:cytochrome P450